jgi:hypothetical protein
MQNFEGINNAIRIPASLKGDFFRVWVEFLTPLHNLNNREKDVLASLLKHRFELSEKILDQKSLDTVLLSADIKAKIKEECNVSNAFFQVILGKLKKLNIITEGRINPLIIPKKVNKDSDSFLLLLYFDLNAE